MPKFYLTLSAVAGSLYYCHGHVVNTCSVVWCKTK